MTQSPCLPELPKPTLVPFDYVHPREVVNSFLAGESIFLVDERNTPWPVIGATERMVSYECVWVSVKGHMQYKFYPNGEGERAALKLLRSQPTPPATTPAPPTQGAEGAAPQAVVGEASEGLWQTVRDVLGFFRLTYWCDADGEGLPLVDHLCRPKARDISDGASELNMLCDDIVAAVSALTPSPTPTAPQEADALREALSELVENADSLLSTIGCIQGRDPEEDDTHVHEKWAMDELKRSADAARAALAQHQPQQGEGA